MASGGSTASTTAATSRLVPALRDWGLPVSSLFRSCPAWTRCGLHRYYAEHGTIRLRDRRGGGQLDRLAVQRSSARPAGRRAGRSPQVRRKVTTRLLDIRVNVGRRPGDPVRVMERSRSAAPRDRATLHNATRWRARRLIGDMCAAQGRDVIPRWSAGGRPADGRTGVEFPPGCQLRDALPGRKTRSTGCDTGPARAAAEASLASRGAGHRGARYEAWSRCWTRPGGR